MSTRNTIAHRYLCGALGLSMYLCLPSVTATAASVSFVEEADGATPEAIVSISANGLSNPQITAQSLEGPGSLGVYNVSFGYISNSAPAAGSSSSTNYNIYEPGVPPTPITLSDTLHILVTGRTPTANDLSNVLVNIQFVSDGDGINPTALIDAFTIFENGQLQTVDTVFGVSDLTVSFQSDVEATPIPAALPLFVSGLGGLGLLGWRRKRKQAA